MDNRPRFNDTILSEAERTVEHVSDLDDDELLYLLSNYENGDELFPEGWSGLATRAAVTFELRRRDFDFERDDGVLTLRGPNGTEVDV